MRPGFASLNMLSPADRATFAEPWPDVLITCGRKSAMLAMAVKQASKGRTTTIHVQDPKASPRNWDLLVVPEHDRVRGPNVVVTQGAPHRVTQLKLRSGAEADRKSTRLNSSH